MLDLYAFFINFTLHWVKYMSRLTAEQKIQPHWWRKTLTGIFLGLTLTYALVGMFAWFGPGGIDAPIKVQFNMWIVSPIWLTILAFTFMFRTAKQAFLTLLTANVLGYGIFFLLWWMV